MKGLIFVIQGDIKYGYRAFESRHLLMISARSRPQLIEKIKKEVHKYFEGTYYGKVILRDSTVDEEIKLYESN